MARQFTAEPDSALRVRIAAEREAAREVYRRSQDTPRIWSGDFVRFTGPGATVEPWSFVLPGDGTAAEMLVATRRLRGPLRFQVTGGDGAVTIHMRDWLRSRSANPICRLRSTMGTSAM